MKKLLFSLLGIALIFTASPLTAKESVAETKAVPDLAREKRMAEEITDVILDGEVVMLKDGENEFMGIDTEPGGESKGAVIILHGRGYHPDWGEAINPLRVGLAETGWRTLSLQMPVLEKSAKYYDYVPIFPAAHSRIEAGIEYLRQAGEKKIVLLAHSCGAHMAMDWVDAKGDAQIDAYIGAGMGATDYKQPMQKPFPLVNMKVPVLDVYGEDEYPAVIRLAPERKAMIEQAGNSKSAQIVVPKANHYFTDKGDVLVETVASWLDTLK